MVDAIDMVRWFSPPPVEDVMLVVRVWQPGAGACPLWCRDPFVSAGTLDPGALLLGMTLPLIV